MRKVKLTILAILATLCVVCAFAACSQQEHVHKIELVEERAATCEQQGTASYYKCKGCGKLFADADGAYEMTEADIEKTEALGHTGGEATCTEQAVCLRCDKPYGELGDHDYTGGWVTDGESHWSGCVNCGEIKEGETKIAHTYNKKVVSEAFVKASPTCQAGTEYYMTCACGAFDEHAESGFYFGKPDPEAHDLGQCYDETQHWYGCRIAGCDRAREMVAEHDISRTYTKTATSHYKTCSGCDIHTDEDEHDYAQHSETAAFVITEPNCQRKGEYHVSCVCGDFEADGETFQTATVGEHDWHYTKTETQHSATCPNCTNTIALTGHDFNSSVSLKDATKVYDEDDVITVADLDIFGKCECGQTTTSSSSISAFSYTVTGDEGETMSISIDGHTVEIEVNSRRLARWNIELVGATRDSAASYQTKAKQTLADITPAVGKTFAGFYYDQDFNVYYTGTIPADYADTNLTAYNINTYKLPDNVDGTAQSLKLTAMFLEDMPHFAPSDFMAADGADKKVGDHVALDNGVVATKFDWTAESKGATYKVRSARDTGTHTVNVTAPAYGKSIMLLYIVNNGTSAATVKYQTEDSGVKGEMTVTVAANATVTVPFAYGIGGATFSACDHWITETSDSAASLSFYGYIVAAGALKINDFTLADCEYEPGKAISIDGTVTMGDNNYPVKVYDVNTDLPEGAMIEQGYHHVTLNAFGLTDSFNIYKKVDHSGWNRVTFGKDAGHTSTVSFTGQLVTINGYTATKYTLPNAVSSGFMALNTNSITQSGTVNSRIPLYLGEARELEFHIINYSDDEFKININPENEGAGEVLTIAGGRSGEEQVFNVTWKSSHGKSTPGGWLNTNICSEVKAGTSFALYGYWKATDTDRTKEMQIVSNPTKTTFKVGDKFSAAGLHVKLNTHSDNNDQTRIVNYVTDYDDYTFTAADIGSNIPVTVYWAGITKTFNITVTA